MTGNETTDRCFILIAWCNSHWSIRARLTSEGFCKFNSLICVLLSLRSTIFSSSLFCLVLCWANDFLSHFMAAVSLCSLLSVLGSLYIHVASTECCSSFCARTLSIFWPCCSCRIELILVMTCIKSWMYESTDCRKKLNYFVVFQQPHKLVTIHIYSKRSRLRITLQNCCWQSSIISNFSIQVQLWFPLSHSTSC